jgi:hypothetical protein
MKPILQILAFITLFSGTVATATCGDQLISHSTFIQCEYEKHWEVITKNAHVSTDSNKGICEFVCTNIGKLKAAKCGKGNPDGRPCQETLCPSQNGVAPVVTDSDFSQSCTQATIFYTIDAEPPPKTLMDQCSSLLKDSLRNNDLEITKLCDFLTMSVGGDRKVNVSGSCCVDCHEFECGGGG